jgi:hypothetical protein
MTTPAIFDKNSQPQSWAWLVGKFGEASISHSEEALAYRLVRIQERQGHSSFVVNLIDEQGNPISGTTVIRYWPDAPKLPEWTPPPERWFEKGVHGETNPEGNIGFGMGGGDQYHPPIPGPSSAWVGEMGVGSDCFHGLGWIVAETDLHLDLTFQRTESQPPPEPSPCPWEQINAYLDGMTEIIAAIRDLEPDVGAHRRAPKDG